MSAWLPALELRRAALQAGEAWRPLTAQLVHWSPAMAAVDLGVLVLAGALLELRSRRLAAAVLSAGAAAVALGLVLLPAPAVYRGSSGLAVAAVAGLAVTAVSAGGRPRAAGALVLAALAVKTAWELQSGDAASVVPLPPGVRVVPGVHAAGLLAGAAAAALFCRRRRDARPPGDAAAVPALLVPMVLPVLLVLPPAHAAGAGPSDRGEARTYTVEIRVRPTRAGSAAACAEMDSSAVEVRLRGERLDPAAVALDRKPKRRVHGILLDTSGSMEGKLDDIRAAAAGYVRRLDPQRERALVMTFDDSPVLVQAMTADRERLESAVVAIRPGGYTAMNDGLVAAIDELSLWAERPAVVLLTDGFDTTSAAFRDDVRAALARRRDLAVFTIGYALPALTASGPSGANSTRKFLQRISGSSDGRFFESGPQEDLVSVYDEIRGLLDSEATVLVADPDPDLPPGKVKLRSSREGCRIEVLGERRDGEAERPPREYVGAVRTAPFHDVDPPCIVSGYGRPHEDSLEPTGDALGGCVLDIVRESGLLHDPYGHGSGAGRWRRNASTQTRRRAVEFPIPPVPSLPAGPAAALDAWAARLVRDGAGAGPAGERRRAKDPAPAPAIADVLVHGSTLLRIRTSWAQALAGREDYAALARAGLLEETLPLLDDLRTHYRLLAPTAGEAAIEAALAQSPEARAIRDGAEHPGPAEWTRRLAAWLGDVPAADLFRDLEGLWMEHLVEATPPAASELVARWQAVHPWFRRADHVRIVGMMLPVLDERSRRVGLYRVALPRPAWVEPRVQGRRGERGWVDVPFDQVPERPLAFEAWAVLLSEEPALAAVLRDGGYRLSSLAYEPLGKPRLQDPARAFRHCRARARFEAASGSGVLLATWTFERKKRNTLEVTRELRAAADPLLLDLLGPEGELSRP